MQAAPLCQMIQNFVACPGAISLMAELINCRISYRGSFLSAALAANISNYSQKREKIKKIIDTKR